MTGAFKGADRIMDGHLINEERRMQDSAPCPFCQGLFSKRSLVLHVNQGCPKEHVECSYCECKFPRDRLEEHMLSCDMRPAKCDYCGGSFKTYSELRDVHYSTCQHKPTQCAYNVFGCEFKGTPDKLLKHDMPNGHAQLLHQRLVAIQEEFKTSQKRTGQEIQRLNSVVKEQDSKIAQLESGHEKGQQQSQDQAAALQDAIKKLEDLHRDHENHTNMAEKIKKGIEEQQHIIRRMSLERDIVAPDFTYTWRIHHYRHLRQVATELNKIMHTDIIATGSPGYRFQFSCGLAGHHMSVYMMIHGGEDDDWLPWPFANRIIVRLKSQNGPQDDEEKVVHPAMSDAACFQKPDKNGHNTRFGFKEFIRIPLLENERKGFIRGDCIVLQFVLVPLVA